MTDNQRSAAEIRFFNSKILIITVFVIVDKQFIVSVQLINVLD